MSEQSKGQAALEAEGKDNKSDYMILFAKRPDPTNGERVTWNEGGLWRAHDVEQARRLFRDHKGGPYPVAPDVEREEDPEIRARFLKAAESEHGALVRAVAVRSWPADGAEEMRLVTDPRWV